MQHMPRRGRVRISTYLPLFIIDCGCISANGTSRTLPVAFDGHTLCRTFPSSSKIVSRDPTRRVLSWKTRGASRRRSIHHGVSRSHVLCATNLSIDQCPFVQSSAGNNTLRVTLELKLPLGDSQAAFSSEDLSRGISRLCLPATLFQQQCNLDSPPPSSVRLAIVDYASFTSLMAALSSTNAVFSTASHLQLHVRLPLARAAKAAGMYLLVPSEYSSTACRRTQT
ncbi:hypothetical protein DENSPDRAFT_842328 [Dentipellis sp. KUC8613]|nr:hypothetical protein DENSPDRAFT_842328 [Dentipellis sp. KUC8613]